MKSENKIWDEHWNRNELWLSFSRFMPAYRKIIKIFKGVNIPRDAKILDTGCGPGKLSHFWAQKGYDIVGIDISDEALRITKEKGVEVIKADAKRMPFKDNTFDLVYTDGLLEHFIDPETILAELFRVSKKYVFNLVPTNSWFEPILIFIFRVPKVYGKNALQWIELHKKFMPASIKSGRAFTMFSILCKKN